MLSISGCRKLSFVGCRDLTLVSVVANYMPRQTDVAVLVKGLAAVCADDLLRSYLVRVAVCNDVLKSG